MMPSRRPDRLSVDPPPGPLPLERAIGDQLPRGPSTGPRDRRTGSDETSPVPLGPNDGAHRRQVPPRLLDRDDLADRPVVKPCGETPSYGDQGGVGPGLSQTGSREDALPGSFEERLLPGNRQRPPDREAPQRSASDLAQTPPPAAAPAESRGEGGVAPRLPRDVGVQPDEARLPDEVDVLLSGEREELRQDPGRAAAPRAVRVIDTDPDRAHPPARWRRGQPGPATYESPARSFW